MSVKQVHVTLGSVPGSPESTRHLRGGITPQRVPDLVADRIAGAIRDGALRPGDRLPTELELARDLEVGRTSVREGLQKLRTLGLVRVVRGHGAFVSAPDQVEAHRTFARWSAEHRFAIEELLETRMAVESTAAALAATRAGAADLAGLEARHADVVRANDAGDLPSLVVADEAFHDAVLHASGNRLLRKVYALLVDEVTEFRSKTLGLDGASDRAVAGHEAVLAAIRRGDAPGARAAMVDHLLVLYEEVREVARSQRADAGDLRGATRETFG